MESMLAYIGTLLWSGWTGLLTHLLSDPELSLQSILVLNKFMGKKKTTIYGAVVTVMSTPAGYIFGLVIAGV